MSRHLDLSTHDLQKPNQFVGSIYLSFASGVQELLSSEAEDIYGNRPVILSLKPMTLIMLSVTRGPGSE